MVLLYDDFGSRERPEIEDAIEIFLDPGEYFVGDSTFKVRTLLGSCVAMVLWHPRLKYGAMSHVLLASRAVNASKTPAKHHHLEGKYADEVIILMMQELKQAKVPLHECKAKLFGGGNMFPGKDLSDKLNVGKKNADHARYLLHHYGFPIIAEDVCGIGHREIIFNVGNGDVWVKQCTPSK